MNISLHSISLSFEDFLLLLEIRGLSIPDESVFAPLRFMKPATDASRLEEAGALETDPVWVKTLETICSPTYQVDSATFLGQSTMATTYFASAKDETLVACTPDGDNIRIVFPFTPEEIVHKELQLFGVGGGTMSDSPVSLKLSSDGLFLWAAGLDALREVMLASMAQRQEVRQIKLPVTAFETLFQSSVDDPRLDSRWLVTLLRMAAPNSFEPQRQKLLPDALDELIAHNLILLADDEQWMPTHQYFAIANDLFSQLPALMISTRQTGGESSRSLHFNGRNGLSTIEFQDGGKEPQAVYKSSGSEELWFFLETAFTPPPLPEKHDEQAGQKFCTGCGNRLEPGVKFCTGCGQAVAE